MKRCKYVLLTLALLAPVGVFAQSANTADNQQEARPMRRHIPDVDTQLQRLSKKLKLTDEQKPQVKTILEEQRNQMQKEMEASSGDPGANRDKMREIHENASSKIRALLTDDQKTKYDKLQAQRQARMQKHWNKRGGGAPDQGGQPQQ
jgi:Spy/CpxP family protein refolding chaperone